MKKIIIKEQIQRKIELRHQNLVFIKTKGKKMDEGDRLRIFGKPKPVIVPMVEPKNDVVVIDIQPNYVPLKYYSIVIPTMWKSDKISVALSIYEKSEYVKEIIVIDNDPTNTIDLSEYSKVRIYTKGKNIYVNPSWNWGYCLSKYNLILLNDDIIIHNFDEVIRLISLSDFDIIGIDIFSRNSNIFKKTNDIFDETKHYDTRVEPIEVFPAFSYGCFMYIKNYVYIPDQLKIWYGDKFLFDINKKRGILKHTEITVERSATVNSDIPEFRHRVGRNDVEIYESMVKSEHTFDIIINVSKRLGHFRKCVESIRKRGIDAKLHIIVDDVNSLDYIKNSVRGLDYNYYLVDKEIAGDIYSNNYCLNIILPFINGWCLFLDDDYQLLVNPKLDLTNQKNVYCFNIGVGRGRIVPSIENFGKHPILDDINKSCLIFHSSRIKDWKIIRKNDYDFINELYENNNTFWINEILSAKQNII